MKILKLFFMFSIITATTFFAMNYVEQNDLRTRYNLTTQEPYLCKLADVSHLPEQEFGMIRGELRKLHQEEGMSCLFDPNALNKDGKSAYQIAKEKYDQTRSNFCLRFIGELVEIEKMFVERNKKLDIQKQQNVIAMKATLFTGILSALTIWMFRRTKL